MRRKGGGSFLRRKKAQILEDFQKKGETPRDTLKKEVIYPGRQEKVDSATR